MKNIINPYISTGLIILFTAAHSFSYFISPGVKIGWAIGDKKSFFAGLEMSGGYNSGEEGLPFAGVVLSWQYEFKNHLHNPGVEFEFGGTPSTIFLTSGLSLGYSGGYKTCYVRVFSGFLGSYLSFKKYLTNRNAEIILIEKPLLKLFMLMLMSSTGE